MRWRRLQQKIGKDHGSEPDLLTDAVDSKATKPINNASAKSAAKVSTPKKRKAKEMPVSESESEGEGDQKRVKTEEVTPPEKRQTRGKKLDLKAMLDSSSSGVSTSYTGPATSIYEDNSGVEDDDEGLSGADSEVLTKKEPEKAKAIKVDGLVSPAKSGSYSSREQPKPSASSIASSASKDDPIPHPLAAFSATIAQSVEFGEDSEALPELWALRNGRFIQSQTPAPSKSQDSQEMYDADESAAPSLATSLQAVPSSTPEPFDEAEMNAVTPDDSISQGGLTRKRRSSSNSTYISASDPFRRCI